MPAKTGVITGKNQQYYGKKVGSNTVFRIGYF
jgi:hypothetical protein